MTLRKVTTVKALCKASGTPYHELCFDDRHSGMIAKVLESTELIDIRPPYVYCGLLKDVHIFGRTFIRSRDGSYVFHCQSYQNYQNYRFGECAEAFIESREDRLFTNYIEEECIFLGGMWSEPEPEYGFSHLMPNPPNFGHYIFEFLERLAVFAPYGLLKKLPVVIYENVPERWLGFLELLGIPASRLIKIPILDSPAFRKVWVASSPNYRDTSGAMRVWGGGVHWLRLAMFEGIGGPRLNQKRRIYLGRQSAKWRRVVNEADVMRLLEEYGFDCRPFEALSTREQVENISGAEIVVAPVGAGTVLTHFAPEHCINLICLPREQRGMWGGYYSAVQLRQVYEWVTCQPDPNSRPWSGNVIDADFIIDTTVLKDKIERALHLISITQVRDALKL